MISFLTKSFFQFLPPDMAGIAAGMVWGQKQYLTAYQYQIFRTTGLLHLLVLSGQNITLLMGFFAILTRYLGLKAKLLITVLIALFYVLVFGGEAPIVRAAIMATLSSLVILAQTTTPALLILAITSLVMLYFKPAWLNSLSFQLSVAATAGILLFYPYFQKQLRLRSTILSAFFLSLSAQIFTTPLLLLNFREISLISLPINAAVSFLVEPIMLIGVALSLLGQLFPLLGQLLGLVLLGLLRLLELMVELSFPFSQLMMLRI